MNNSDSLNYSESVERTSQVESVLDIDEKFSQTQKKFKEVISEFCEFNDINVENEDLNMEIKKIWKKDDASRFENSESPAAKEILTRLENMSTEERIEFEREALHNHLRWFQEGNERIYSSQFKWEYPPSESGYQTSRYCLWCDIAKLDKLGVDTSEEVNQMIEAEKDAAPLRVKHYLILIAYDYEAVYTDKKGRYDLIKKIVKEGIEAGSDFNELLGMSGSAILSAISSGQSFQFRDHNDQLQTYDYFPE